MANRNLTSSNASRVNDNSNVDDNENGENVNSVNAGAKIASVPAKGGINNSVLTTVSTEERRVGSGPRKRKRSLSAGAVS